MSFNTKIHVDFEHNQYWLEQCRLRANIERERESTGLFLLLKHFIRIDLNDIVFRRLKSGQLNPDQIAKLRELIISRQNYQLIMSKCAKLDSSEFLLPELRNLATSCFDLMNNDELWLSPDLVIREITPVTKELFVCQRILYRSFGKVLRGWVS